MLMPSIFGEDLFDDWMRLPVEITEVTELLN